MKKNTLLIALIFLTPLCFQNTGCSFLSEKTSFEKISVELPVWPPEKAAFDYPQLAYWNVVIAFPSETKIIKTTEQSLSVKTKLNVPFSVTATPVTKMNSGEHTIFFKPAGSIYPYSCKNKTLKLNYTEGFCAYVMERLISSKLETGITTEHLEQNLACFNWKKFTELIEKNIEKSREDFIQEDNSNAKFYNPWLIELQPLLDNLSITIFQSDDANTKYIYSVPESILGFSENTYILSSFIPENQILARYKRLSLKKNVPELFLTSLDSGVNLTCSSAKKVSLILINLPTI